MEPELFGTEGSQRRGRKIGALEEAHGGTLYLDEVADMPRETQGKILRVLIDQNFLRVGGATRVNRSMSASSRRRARDLEREIAGGQLPRGSVPPPLRGAAARAGAGRAARRRAVAGRSTSSSRSRSTTGLPVRRVGDDALAVLQAHDWPGNIRQLRNNIERLLILARGGKTQAISADMLPPEVGEMLPTTPNRRRRASDGRCRCAMPAKSSSANI